MAKPVKVIRTSDSKKATTAEHKRVRALRRVRQMEKAALTFPGVDVLDGGQNDREELYSLSRILC